MKTTTKCVLAILIAAPHSGGVFAQGLIGTPWFGINAGYERIRNVDTSEWAGGPGAGAGGGGAGGGDGLNGSGNGGSYDDYLSLLNGPPPAPPAATNRTLDGFGVGADFNFPLTGLRQEVGMDVWGEVDYFRVKGSGLTLHNTSLAAGMRAYVPLQQVLKPYVATGIGWARAKGSFQGVSESDDTVFFPLEAGVEWASGPYFLTPYYRYTINTDGGFDNFWEIGGTLGYWFNRGMAATVKVSHTDYKGDERKLGVRVGLAFSF